MLNCPTHPIPSTALPDFLVLLKLDWISDSGDSQRLIQFYNHQAEGREVPASKEEWLLVDVCSIH
jgi:hypothetical protein